MTNLRGVGGAPRGLRTHQPSLHGRRPHQDPPNHSASTARIVTTLDRTQGQRQRDDHPSHQRTTIHHKRKKLAPTTHPSTIKSKPTNLKGDDQGDHAESKETGTSHEATKYSGRRGKDMDGWQQRCVEDKGCRRHDFKGWKSSVGRGNARRFGVFRKYRLDPPRLRNKTELKGVPCTAFAKGCVEI